MARYLALEWDNREVRMACASTRGERVILEQAFAVPLPARAEGEGDSEERAGRAIAAALAERRIGRVETLVAVGRASIELRRMSLPPAPDEELPEMVRFQAQREFTSLPDDWPLDFVPLDHDPAQQRNVLAATVSAEFVEQIQSTCRQANIQPRRLVLRPCAAASLLRRQRAAGTEHNRLLVCLLGDEADLTVLVDGQVVFLRTARLPGDVLAGPGEGRPLAGEIRRTMAAVQNQLAGLKVEAIDLCGASPAHAALAPKLEAELSLPVRLFDPFAGVSVGAEVEADPPDHADRFAPLLGMLMDEAAGVRHSFDFLNPRRRPPPPDQRRRYATYGTAAAAAVVLAGGWIWLSLRSLDAQIAELNQRGAQAEPVVKRANDLQAKAKQIQQWTDQRVVWLDELREMAVDLSPAKDAMLTSLNISKLRDGTGQVAIDGLVRTDSTIDELENRLRDESHRVVGNIRELSSTSKLYAYKFKSNVFVTPSTPEKYLERLKNAPKPEEPKPEESKADAVAAKPENSPPQAPGPSAPGSPAPQAKVVTVGPDGSTPGGGPSPPVTPVAPAPAAVAPAAAASPYAPAPASPYSAAPSTSPAAPADTAPAAPADTEPAVESKPQQ